MKHALDGVRVVECAGTVGGPYCGKLLGDLGAEVVKVEPSSGDAARRRGPFPGNIPHQEKSGLFLYLNTNKLGVTLNLQSERGRRLLMELVRDADVLIEDSPPSKSDEFGLSYDALSVINPRLVMTSITPFGKTGPYRDYRAYPLTTSHGGGEGYLLPGGVHNMQREPIKGAGFLNEYDSGLYAAVAVLGALYLARITGKGQHIDVSKQEAGIAMNRVELARYRWDGVVESRAIRGPRPGSTIRCRDGFVQMQVPGDHQWAALKAAMGNPSWADDPKYRDRPSRAKHVDELNAGIEEWAGGLTAAEVARKVQAEGGPAAPYNTVGDLLKDEQLAHRGFFAEVEHPAVGKLPYPTAAYKLSRSPVVYQRPAPLLGQHNQLIFGERLGYSKEDIVRLKQAGII